MKKLLLGFLAAAALALMAGAANAEPQVIPLWPDLGELKPDEIGNDRIQRVHTPTLTVYVPEKANGTAVILCPGGGYWHLGIGEGGGPDTKFFNSIGVTVFILKYRVKTLHPAPLRDALRAIRLVRSRAAEFGVKSDRIGIKGASAGGHVALSASVFFDAPEGKTDDPLDAISGRPDFTILVYPVVSMGDKKIHKGSRDNLLGQNPTEELKDRLSVEKQVRKDMPPVFIAATMADKSVPVENSLRLYQALRDANVPAEMHVYAQGSHGNSLDPQYGPTAKWPLRVEEWMRFNGWLPAAN